MSLCLATKGKLCPHFNIDHVITRLITEVDVDIVDDEIEVNAKEEDEVAIEVIDPDIFETQVEVIEEIADTSADEVVVDVDVDCD